jgi:succinate dehydrogenase / fumarate reductase cytochrome b subunit
MVFVAAQNRCLRRSSVQAIDVAMTGIHNHAIYSGKSVDPKPMTTTSRRPVYLNLLKIKLPIAGIMSIIHRATGVFMFLALPYLIRLLDLSLSGPGGYAEANAELHGVIGVVFVFLVMWSLAHHFLAGVRYLLIDVDYGVEKEMAQQTALGVVIAGPILGLLLAGGVL